MNINIFQTIFRAAVILGVAFFGFVHDVFAAPALTPATAIRITENSATLVGHVANPYKSTAVWFEVSEGTGSFTTVGVQPPLYDGGTSVTFEYLLRDLKQGQTYSYRSVAMEGGVTVYSPTGTFTTVVPKTIEQTVVVSSGTKATQTTSSAVKTQEVKTNTTAGNKGATTTPVTTEGFTNTNSAALIGVGSGLLPTTLIGWIVLLIAILVVVILFHMVQESFEERKRVIEEKKRKEEEEALAEKKE